MTDRILLIEDDPRLAEMVKNYLGEAGFAVTVASLGLAGIALEAREHKAAFDTYVRHGESANLRALETKAMSAGSNPDGGYTVPVEIEIEGKFHKRN